MNKTQLISEMSQISGLTKKDTEKSLNAFMECIITALKKDEKVQLVGFGTFEARKRGPRPGRNPKKPEVEIMIPSSVAPVFKAGKVLKDSLNQ